MKCLNKEISMSHWHYMCTPGSYQQPNVYLYRVNVAMATANPLHGGDGETMQRTYRGDARVDGVMTEHG